MTDIERALAGVESPLRTGRTLVTALFAGATLALFTALAVTRPSMAPLLGGVGLGFLAWLGIRELLLGGT